MSEQTFAQLDELKQTSGPAAAIDRLIEMLKAEKEYHRLFDALLMKQKFEMGLPLVKPTSFDDVPEEHREAFEDAYIASARQVGELLLADNRIPQAWIYFRTIREPEKVAEALDAVQIGPNVDESTEELINVALYEGANPPKGLEIMLKTHGTCNTVTAMDQMIHQMQPADRQRAAKMLVSHLYEELSQTLQREVQQRMALAPPATSIRELITGREWLFADGNYHIDVSHLNAVVRFARTLDAGTSELKQAVELAEYGAQLSPQFQYAGEPPFENFYEAHRHFLKVLANQNVDEGLAYFREKLAAEPDDEDKQLIAFVLVDLCLRIGRLEDALPVAEEYLNSIEDPSGFSFAELCHQVGRMDTLRKIAKEKGDLLSYTAALIQDGTAPVSA